MLLSQVVYFGQIMSEHIGPISRRIAATLELVSRNIALLYSVLARNQSSTITTEDLVQLISSTPRDITESVETDLIEIQSNSERLQVIAKQNFTLSRDLQDLDDKIKMLIKNRITVEEIAQTVSHLMREGGTASSINLTLEQKELYGSLLFLLQSDPSYVSSLIRVLPGSETDSFVQIVLFTLFGSQYDGNEEKILLTVLRTSLEAEFRQSTELSTFMRTNSCLTSLLSQYARRPASVSSMKIMLGGILDEILKAETIKFELDPVQLYHEVISTEETASGRVSTLPKDVSQEQAAENPTVQRLTLERCELIKFYCNRIFDAVLAGIPNVMYGIRWICREMNSFSNQFFPTATAVQRHSIVGGYFFLRFLNPMVVTPDGSKITAVAKVGKNARKNLTLIAKVLQNMSNGIPFGGIKEGFMAPLNSYLNEKRPMFEAIISSLIAVDDLDDVLAQDTFSILGNSAARGRKNSEMTSSTSAISMAAAALRSSSINKKRLQVDYNEIMKMHRLVRDFKKDVTKPNDPILPVLLLLASQPTPDDVPRQDSTTFTIYLSPPRGLANMYVEVEEDSSSPSSTTVSVPSTLMTQACRLNWISSVMENADSLITNPLSSEEKTEFVSITLDRVSAMSEMKNFGGIRLKLRQQLYKTPGNHDVVKKISNMTSVGDDGLSADELHSAMNAEETFTVLSVVSIENRNNIERMLRQLFWLQYTRQVNAPKYSEILERIASVVRRCRFSWMSGDSASKSSNRKSLKLKSSLSKDGSKKLLRASSSGKEDLDDLLLGDIDKIDEIGILGTPAISSGSGLKKKLAARKNKASIDLLDEDVTEKRESFQSFTPPPSHGTLFDLLDGGKDNAVADDDFNLAQELKSIKDDMIRFATNAQTMYLTESGQAMSPVCTKEEERIVNSLIKEHQRKERDSGEAQTSAEKKDVEDLKVRHQRNSTRRLQANSLMDLPCQDLDTVWVYELQQQVVREVHFSLRAVADSRDKIRRNREKLQLSLSIMEEQSAELRESLEFYRTYLDNTRGGAAAKKPAAQEKQVQKASKGSAPEGEVRFTYKQLCDQSIIIRSSLPESALKHANFVFSESLTVRGQFEIKVIIKGVTVHRTNLFLDELLEDLSRRVYEVELEDIVFSVNLLIHLLNTHFVK